MIFKKIAPLFLTALFLSPWLPATAAVTKPDATPRQVLKATGQLHVPFVENRGQAADPAVAYVADIFACQVAVTRNGEIIYSRPHEEEGAAAAMKIKERLVGPAVKIDVTGLERQAAKVSYYQGRDPAKWHANLPTYARVALGRTAPGIRAELRAHGRNVEKFFYLEPGADPVHIRLAVEGAQNLSVGADGALELSTPSGESMRFTTPVAYQERNGQRRMVPVRYLVSENSYGFDLGPYDRSRELVIDPLVEVFSVNTGFDNAVLDVATDAQGNVYAAGYSNNRLAIWKLDSRLEKLLASVYFSSQGEFFSNSIRSIALDGRGNVFVSGYTNSLDFPVTPGCHDANRERGIGKDGFVTKFSADLGTMLASTFVGGDGDEELYAMVINDRDKIYVAGYSAFPIVDDAQLFPVTDGAFDIVRAGYAKSVVARLDNNLSTVEAATFLGGSDSKSLFKEEEEAAYTIAIDARGDVWVAGLTRQPDFPVTDGCGDPTYNGGEDVFLSKFNADLQHLLVSTYLGANQDEVATDMLLDGQGNIYLTGYTYSGNFPMPDDGYDTGHSLVEEDGFILKISPEGNKILAGTFLGGTDNVQNDKGDDRPAAMALTADGNELVVVGRTESQSFPTTPGCLDNVMGTHWNEATRDRDFATLDNDRGDGFIATLSSDLTHLVHSTFVGGDRLEYLDAVLFNGDDLIVAGETYTLPTPSENFPFPIDDPDDDSPGSMAIVMRFTAGENPDAPNNPDNVTNESGGGGGGGCFIDSISY